MSTVRTFVDQISDHLPALRRYARSLYRQRDQADDLEQDCIERALAKRHLYQPDTNLRAWLFTIMRNLATTQLRHTAFRERSRLYYGARTLTSVPASQDVVVELNECLALTRTFPAFDQRVLGHMCIEDLGYDETARRIGKPAGTIKSRLSRARQRLRDAVEDPALRTAA